MSQLETKQGIVSTNQGVLYGNYIYATDRLKKLSAAIYVVTDLIKEGEPLKHSIRQKSISLITDIFSLRSNNTIHISQKTALKISLDEITTLLELAGFVKLVSEMNARFLIEEYRKLTNIFSETNDISISISDTSIPQEEVIKMDAAIQDFKRTELPLRNMSFKIDSDKKAPPQSNTNADQNVSEKSLQKQYYLESLNKPKVLVKKKKQEEKNDRKQNILGLFIKGTQITIKDISSKISGYSEKTIQRELNALVDLGKITRIGEKRWSKYLLK